MTTPEGKVKGWLDQMLRAEGVPFFSPQAGPHGGAGVHDRIANICGLFVSIEAKANSKCKMTALQLRFMYKHTKEGGVSFLVYDKATIELVRQFIQNVRAYRSRQEGGDCCVGGPRQYLELNTNSKGCSRQVSDRTAPTGRDSSITQPGYQRTGADPVLLQLARSL